MVRFLSKLLDIRPGEWPRFSLLYLMLFIIFSGLVWGSSIAEASFLQIVGLTALPIFFIVKAILSIPAVAVYTAFADRVRNDRLLIAIMVIGATLILISLSLIRAGFDRLGYPLLYLLVFVPLDDILFTHWFTYVYGQYDTRSAKRIVPVLATAIGLGGIVAGLTLSFLNRLLSPGGVIAVWAGSLLIAALLVWLTPYLLKETAAPAQQETIIGSEAKEASFFGGLQEGFRYVSQSTFLRWMALSTLALMILLTLLEYRTGAILINEFAGSVESMSNFFGLLTSVANLIFLPIQLFLLSRIIGRIGLGNANLIFPIGTIASVSGLILAPSRLTATIAYVNRIDFYNNFGYLTNSLLYNAVPLRIKGRARAFVGGLVVPIGALVGGLLLLLPAALLDSLLPALMALLAVTVLGIALVLRGHYRQALIAMLEEEDFSFLMADDVGELPVADPATLNTLKKKLVESSSPELTIFMAKLISQIGGRDAVPILGDAARKSEEAHLRSAILDVLVASETRGEAVRQLYADFLNDPDGRVRESAFTGLEQLAEQNDKQFLTLAQELLRDSNVDVQARVLSSLVRLGNFYSLTPAVELLSELLAADDVQQRARGVQILGELSDQKGARNLIQYLDDPADEVRLEAAVALETICDKALPADLISEVADAIQPLLHDPVERIRQATLTILGRIGSQKAHAALVSALSDASPEVRTTAVETLVHLGKTIVPTIHPHLNSNDPRLRKMAAVILARISPREFGALIGTHVTGNLIQIYRDRSYREALTRCQNVASIAILDSLWRERSSQLLDEIFYLLTALHQPSAVNVLVQSFHSDDSRTRANATEALESMTTPQTARLVEPLFEANGSTTKILDVAKETWDMHVPPPDQLIRKLASEDEDPWVKTIVVFALGEIGAAAWARWQEQVKKGEPAAPAAPPPANPLDALLPSPAPAPEGQDKRRPRRRSADIFGALMDEPAAAAPESKPAAASTPAITETVLGSVSFTAEDVRRLSAKPAVAPQSDTPCDALFSVQEIEQLLAAALVHPLPEIRVAGQAANRVMGGVRLKDLSLEENIVLSTIEKIIFLKEVPFFQGMTIDQLKVLANVCEEEFFKEDVRIFHQGDLGGVLYVVVSGRVGIEQEKRKGSFARLATMGPHTYFGEMNLFDNSPRSASAIALQDTLTLRLRREPLIALARQYPSLSLELINVLSARLRETSDRVADLTRTRPRELHKFYDKFEE
jgi:CRP/FNR family cyclic AMP-dependent transcriptional regulator